MYGELGRAPLQNKVFFSVVNFWFKILEAEENKYIKLAYQLMMNDIENKPNCLNWAFRVKQLLSTLGFYEVWVNQGVGNKNVFLCVLKQRLLDNFSQGWSSRLAESSRANFYSLFSSFEHQFYLDFVKIKKFRVAMKKLRTSSHRLEIEVGRWARPNRIPITCNKLEDEFHFLLECSLYNDLRKQYIKRYYWKRPNILKLKELMSTTNKRILSNLSLYIFKAFKIRWSIGTTLIYIMFLCFFCHMCISHLLFF